MAPRYRIATDAFQETLEQLDLPRGSLDTEEQAELGRRGALLATALLQWEEHLGPLLDWRRVASLMGTVSTRRGVNDLAKRGRLLALFDDAALDRWTVASWFVTGQGLLDDEAPASWLKAGKDPALAIKAAERVAGRLAR
jgi:hypothetical protein